MFSLWFTCFAVHGMHWIDRAVDSPKYCTVVKLLIWKLLYVLSPSFLYGVHIARYTCSKFCLTKYIYIFVVLHRCADFIFIITKSLLIRVKLMQWWKCCIGISHSHEGNIIIMVRWQYGGLFYTFVQDWKETTFVCYHITVVLYKAAFCQMFAQTTIMMVMVPLNWCPSNN